MAPKRNSKSRFYWLQVTASLIGVALSLYLLIQHTRVKTGIQGSASFCSLGGFADCDVVNASEYAELGGVPIATFGSIFYFLLLVLGFVAPPKDRSFRSVQKIMAWLAAVGLGIDMVLFVVQVVSLKSLCVMCFGTYLATSLSFFSNVMMVENHRGARIRTALFPAPAWKEIRLSGAALAISVLGLVSFSTVAALLPIYIRTSSHQYMMVGNAMSQFYQTWKEKPARNIGVSEGDATRGNVNAPVRIIEFSDFECPHCRRAAFTLHAALGPMEDKVFFVFKHYPLSSACNPSVSYMMHANACNLARLGYCAVKKGKFWAYHDLVFMRISDEEVHENWSVLQDLLSPVFNRSEIAACLEDEKSLQNVSESIRLGNSLGVKGTPSIYIDGKLMSPIPVTVETIRKLISMETGN